MDPLSKNKPDDEFNIGLFADMLDDHTSAKISKEAILSHQSRPSPRDNKDQLNMNVNLGAILNSRQKKPPISLH
jgi:hypothetical protein